MFAEFCTCVPVVSASCGAFVEPSDDEDYLLGGPLYGASVCSSHALPPRDAALTQALHARYTSGWKHIVRAADSKDLRRARTLMVVHAGARAGLSEVCATCLRVLVLVCSAFT